MISSPGNAPARYVAYGLNIASEYALSGPRSTHRHEPPDVTIEAGRVDLHSVDGSLGVAPGIWASGRVLWFDVPDVAAFRVEDGRRIIVEGSPGADRAEIGLYLAGVALGTILMQRGLLVLHGNAVRVGQSAVVCVGHSGSGKSTVAAEFARRGYQVLSDDVAPVDDSGRALPGIPRVRLTAEAMSALRFETGGLRPTGPDVKYEYLLPEPSFATDAAPVRWVYVLTPGASGPHIEEVQGMDRLIHLHAHTYRFGLLQAMGMEVSHLHACADLARRANLAVVERSRADSCVEDVVDAILADVKAHP